MSKEPKLRDSWSINDEEFINFLLAHQSETPRNCPFAALHDGTRALRLIDDGKLGMDGFKYCWPEVAKDNRRRTLAALKKVHA